MNTDFSERISVYSCSSVYAILMLIISLILLTKRFLLEAFWLNKRLRKF